MRELGVPDPAVLDVPGIGVFLLSIAIVIVIGWLSSKAKRRG